MKYFALYYLAFIGLSQKKKGPENISFSYLGFHRVKTDREVQKILVREDKVPEAAWLRARGSMPEAGQTPGFQRSCKDQPKTNSSRS